MSCFDGKSSAISNQTFHHRRQPDVDLYTAFLTKLLDLFLHLPNLDGLAEGCKSGQETLEETRPLGGTGGSLHDLT
jgi:hypothetical protein